ncbi:MAG: energy transducer TonB [Bacteroidota bacterium]
MVLQVSLHIKQIIYIAFAFFPSVPMTPKYHVFLIITLVCGFFATVSKAQNAVSAVGAPDDCLNALSHVKVPALFPGGHEALFTYISSNVKYPAELAAKGISGKAYISFIVDTKGRPDDFTLLRSSGNTSLDDEALRVTKAMPANWSPAEEPAGTKVCQKMVIPVSFKADVAPVMPVSAPGHK